MLIFCVISSFDKQVSHSEINLACSPLYVYIYRFIIVFYQPSKSLCLFFLCFVTPIPLSSFAVQFSYFVLCFLVITLMQRVHTVGLFLN